MTLQVGGCGGDHAAACPELARHIPRRQAVGDAHGEPVTLKVTSHQALPHPMLKREAIGADATTQVKRSDLNMGKHVP